MGSTVIVFTLFRGSLEAVFLLFRSPEGPRNYPGCALKDVPPGPTMAHLRVSIGIDADCRGVRMTDFYRSLIKTACSVVQLSLSDGCNYWNP